MREQVQTEIETTELLRTVRTQIINWERAPFGGREEFEAAEAATRAMAELDRALCNGAPLPRPWLLAQQHPGPQDREHQRIEKENAA